MRLVDADALYKYITNKVGGVDCAVLLDNEIAPTIDAVEVVRCKECRYREFEGEITHFYWCRINERPVDDDDFCAWAERREDGEA